MLAAKIDRHAEARAAFAQTLTMDVNTLEAAHQAGVTKCVWLSSAAAYPSSTAPVKEEEMFNRPAPDNSFSLRSMTRAVEALCEKYAGEAIQRMATIVLRPTAIYGPYGDLIFPRVTFFRRSSGGSGTAEPLGNLGHGNPAAISVMWKTSWTP